MLARRTARIARAIAILLACIVATLMLLPHAASAHLLPKQNATLHIIGDKGYLVVSVPASALAGIDRDGDGLLSPAEIGRNRDAIIRQFKAGFHVRSDAGEAPIEFALVLGNGATIDSSPYQRSPHDPASYVIVMAGAQFAAPPRTVTISTGLFGTQRDARMLTLRARMGDRIALAVLTPEAPSQQLFQGWFATFRSFVGLGVEHILTGYDHLLFLLTILIAGAGLRYWLSLITSFTVAHSITLTLAMLGAVRISPALVEPAIALSIVAVALYNIFGRGENLRARVAIVFACGLIHGLGFAGALDSIGLAGGNRVATLAGFNIGVEIGQFVFVGALLIVLRMLVMAIRSSRSCHLTRPVSAIAAIGAIALFIDRIVPLVGHI